MSPVSSTLNATSLLLTSPADPGRSFGSGQHWWHSGTRRGYVVVNIDHRLAPQVKIDGIFQASIFLFASCSRSSGKFSKHRSLMIFPVVELLLSLGCRRLHRLGEDNPPDFDRHQDQDRPRKDHYGGRVSRRASIAPVRVSCFSSFSYPVSLPSR
jgi:hypothetical protein